MTPKEKAMKDIIDRFSWDSDVKVISNSIDIALKEQAKEIFDDYILRFVTTEDLLKFKEKYT